MGILQNARRVARRIVGSARIKFATFMS